MGQMPKVIWLPNFYVFYKKNEHFMKIISWVGRTGLDTEISEKDGAADVREQRNTQFLRKASLAPLHVGQIALYEL